MYSPKPHNPETFHLNKMEMACILKRQFAIGIKPKALTFLVLAGIPKGDLQEKKFIERQYKWL